MAIVGQDESRSNPLESEDFEEDDDATSLAGGGEDAADLDEPRDLPAEVSAETSRYEEKMALRSPPPTEEKMWRLGLGGPRPLI